MVRLRHFRSPLLVGLLAVILTACASPRPAPVAVDDAFSRFAAAEVLRTGFGNIQDRYIETTSPSVLTAPFPAM